MSERLQNSWADILLKGLTDVTSKVEDYDGERRDFEEVLLEPLSISGGEEFSAEDHRGREILELLQNARDAARVNDDSDAGSASEVDTVSDEERTGERGVYIGISDRGLMIANTGDAFDFRKSDVRKALQILGESDKGTDSIGEFGVGLTSIRAIGESYEVWTKDPGRSAGLSCQDCWRVFCGPRTLTAALTQYEANTLEGDSAAAYDQFTTGVLDESRDLFDNDSATSLPGSSEFPDPDQLPYFTYPVGMESWYGGVDSHPTEEWPLRRRALQLLHESPSVATDGYVPPEVDNLREEVGPLTTAIFVDFADDDWRAIYDGLFDDPEMPPPESHSDELLKQAFYDDGAKSVITPELLLNIGGIDYVVVEDFTQQRDEAMGGDARRQYWTVKGRQRVRAEADDEDDSILDRKPSTENGGKSKVQGTKLRVELEGTQRDDSKTWSFWEFEYSEGRSYDHPAYDWYGDETDRAGDNETSDSDESRQVEVSLLIPEESDSYRPHLYYPIGDAEPDFPFCIHGDFVVEQNRKQLSGTELARNCVVTTETARLVGHVSEVIAQSDVMKADIPWDLFPTAPSNSEHFEDRSDDEPYSKVLATADDVDNNAPFTALQAEIYDRLREHRCLSVLNQHEPVGIAGDSDTEVILDEDPAVLAALRGFWKISDSETMEDVAKNIESSLPTEQTLRSGLALVTDAESEPDHDATAGVQSVFDKRKKMDGYYRSPELEAFVSGPFPPEDAVEHTVSFDKWSELVGTWSRHAADGVTLEDVDYAIAHILLDVTMDIAEESELSELHHSTDSDASGPYVLPCRRVLQGDFSDEEDPETVQLVSIERHQADHSEGPFERQSNRQVMRPKKDSEVTTVRLPPDSEFDMYFLTRRAQRKHETRLAGTDWGTRKYNGPVDFYRTLLKDAAMRDGPLTKRDITFLAERYEDLDWSNSPELQPVSGSCHPTETVYGLPSQGSDASDNLKIRLQARRVKLPSELLPDDVTSRHGNNLHFSQDTYKAWRSLSGPDTEDAEEEDDDSDDSTPINEQATRLPEVGTASAVPPSDLDGANLSGFAGQLGIFGTSVLPGVRVITIARDAAHPDRNTAHWNPVEGDSWANLAERGNGRGDVGEKPSRARALRETLSVESGRHPYLELISTPAFGPNVSSKHTSSCSMKNYPQASESGTLFDRLAGVNVNLASWVWLDKGIRADLTATDLEPILSYHGEDLTDRILQTGWSCNADGGHIRDVDSPIPSLLNWQLRDVKGWEAFDDTWFDTPTEADRWERKEWSVRYAVLDTTDGGSDAAALLPQIRSGTDENPISDDVWRRLGVKPLEDLNATEAALRLNELLNEWGHELQESDARPLQELPEQHGWDRLYGVLLSKIGEELSASDDDRHVTLESLQFLDWIPVVANDGGESQWYLLPVKDIETFEVFYYDTEEDSWEDRIARLDSDEDQYLLRRPDRNVDKSTFKKIGQHCGATQRSAQYQELDRETTNLSLGKELSSDFSTEMKYGLLAAAPDSRDLDDLEQKCDQIIETLRKYDGSEHDTDAAWAVIPIDEPDGLESVTKVKTDATSYWIAYDENQIDAIEELDIVFQALFEGGKRDSYRLALLEGDVSGKEDVERELKIRGQYTLEQELTVAASVLDVEQCAECLPEDFGATIDTVRTEIASRLADETMAGVRDDPLSGDVGSSVNTIVSQFRSTENDDWLSWVATWLHPETEASDTASELGVGDTEIASWQQTLLTTLELKLRQDTNGLSFDSFLPDGDVQMCMRRLSSVCEAIEEYDATNEIFDTSTGINWPAPVETSLPVTNSSWADKELPKNATWFHLSWLADEADEQSPVEFTSPLVDELVEEVPYDGDEQRTTFRDALERYLEGETVITESSSSTSARDNELLKQTSSAVELGEVNVITSESGSGGFQATPRGSGDGGYSGSTTDRPRVAELAVLREVYSALYDGVIRRAAETSGSAQVNQRIQTLENDGNDWHTHSGWSDVEALPDEELPNPTDPLAKTLPGEAFDVTDERGPGYDILDPTGWVLDIADDMGVEYSSGDYTSDPEWFTPVPIEVKSVTDTDDTAFRFSINQFRRALEFVSEGDDKAPRVPYAILLMDVRETPDEERPYDCAAASLKVCSTPEDVYALLPGEVEPDDDELVNKLLRNLLRGGKLVIS